MNQNTCGRPKMDITQHVQQRTFLDEFQGKHADKTAFVFNVYVLQL